MTKAARLVHRHTATIDADGVWPASGVRCVYRCQTVADGYTICDAIQIFDEFDDRIMEEHVNLSEIIVDVSKSGDKHVYRVTVNRPFVEPLVNVYECTEPFDFCGLSRKVGKGDGRYTRSNISTDNAERLSKSGLTQLSCLNQLTTAKTEHGSYIKFIGSDKFECQAIREALECVLIEELKDHDSASKEFAEDVNRAAELLINTQRRTLRKLTKAFKHHCPRAEDITEDQRAYLHRLLEGCFSVICTAEDMIVSYYRQATSSMRQVAIDYLDCLIAAWSRYHASHMHVNDIMSLIVQLTVLID